MLNLTPDEKKALKGRGIIMTRDGEHFIARVITVDGTLTAEQMNIIAQAAKTYGSGVVAMTSRMTVEVQGLTYDTIEPFTAFLAEHDLYTGGTGTRVRPIVPCKGTVCVHGLIDTQALAREIHEVYYKGWYDVKLPHKFKIGIGGCPNNCIKPALNDFGVMGHPKGYRVMVGGIWGKRQRMATMLDGVYSKEELMSLIEKTLLLFREQGYAGERLGLMIERIGVDNFVSQLLSDEVLARKEAILADPNLPQAKP